jgi:hypothetical protein
MDGAVSRCSRTTELVVWSANLHLFQIKSPKPEHILFFYVTNMLKTEAMYITPDDVLQNQTEEFFDFEFKMVAGQPVECTYK